MGVPVQHEITAPVCFINLTHHFPRVKRFADIERLCKRSSLYVLKIGSLTVRTYNQLEKYYFFI